MFKILIAEDDIELRRLFSHILTKNGYLTVGVSNGQEALDAMDKDYYDLIISDIMMPIMNGYEFVRLLRNTGNNTPVMMITAKDAFDDMREGFVSGTDDYMVKPIDLDELFLRIGALLRRAKIAASRKIEVGNFIMDADEHTAYLDGEEIPLTAREFSLLYKLLSYPKKTFTRTQLMDEFWDADTASGPRTVDVYMTKLRGKLADCNAFEIVTVHGLGYKAVIK